jgi:outer membrane biosynthesis protein TonB
MKTQLIVKYKSGKHPERTLKMQAQKGPRMIGTARKAHLRVVGEDIASFHAAVECRKGEWFISDMASDSGTWADKENFIEKKIEKELDVRIGDHDFHFKVIPAPTTLFNFEERRGVSPDIHEVVVKSFGKIIETHYLDKNEPFIYNNGFGGFTKLPPPPTTAWVYNEISGFHIQQRLRSYPRPLELPKTQKIYEQKTYQAIIGIGFLMILLGIYFFPKQPHMDVPSENKYARIIYDAKLVKEKKQQAANVEQKMQKAESKTSSPAQTKALEQSLAKAGASQKTVKAISQIRASGLKNLLGRIAVRANMNADMIQVRGGSKTGTQTEAFGNTAVGQGFGSAKNAEKSVGITGVGTTGKGGGTSAYKGLGKLSQGEIGQASTVGMLDEEAEVSGGIDKDAIAEVIRSNIGQIRFCYERRLSAVPNLYGKVLVQFSIQDGGTVLLPKVSQSTLSDSVVEGCILRRIASWKFPSPPAGTSVMVTYPFLFKSTQ